MAKKFSTDPQSHISPFEQIKKINPQTGDEFWSSRDFAAVLGYADYRNFEDVIEKAKLACKNSGHKIEDHFGEVTDMIALGKGAKRRGFQIGHNQLEHNRDCPFLFRGCNNRWRKAASCK